MNILLEPVAFVTNQRKEITDDFWGDIISEITLAEHIPTEAFEHIESFSHLEIIYAFDKVDENDIVINGHPRGNTAYPNVGIFAQRKKNRPNRLGLCAARLIKHEGRTITVRYLDAINNTPYSRYKTGIYRIRK